MFVSFVLAAGAGYAAPFVEPSLRRAIAAILKADVKLGAADMRVLTLIGLLLLAVLLTLAMGQRSIGLATVLGAGLGYFGTRLYVFLRDPDGTDVAPEAQWDGRIRPAGTNRPSMDPAAQQEADTQDTLASVRAALGPAGAQPPPETDADPEDVSGRAATKGSTS